LSASTGIDRRRGWPEIEGDRIMTEDIEWFVGFDWANQTHVACLLDRNGQVVGERKVAHGGAELGEFCDWLVAKSGAPPARIGDAIETAHGPVVETLLERGFAVFAINPTQLDRFRDRFTMAGAKDGRRDAHVLSRQPAHRSTRLSQDGR
jgi:hypothetical protein